MLDGCFDELFAPFFDVGLHVFRNVEYVVVQRIARFVPYPSFASEEIDDSLEVVFFADGQYHYDRLCSEHLFDLLDDAEEVSADTVELVYVDDTRNFRIISVTPVGFGLGLYAARTTEYADAAIENLQRTINFDSEVNVAGSIDDVESVVFPKACCSSGLNRDATFLLLFHKVSRCSSIVNFADLVDLASELEKSLSCGRLACVDVGEDSDISIT